MAKKTEQDALMIRYLLGSATEEQQARLEEQFFGDDDLYQQLRALEDELRYEYAQGGLTAGERKSFESRYLVSAQDRQGVALAKAVLDKSFEMRKETAALAPAPEKSVGWWLSLFSSLTPQRLAFGASALALVVLSGGSLMMLQTMQLRDEVAQLRAQRKQVELEAGQQIATERHRQEQLSQELAKERARQSDLGRQLDQRSKSFFGFVLMPGLVRGADGPKRLLIPPHAGDVVFELDVNKKIRFQKYRAELQNLDGDVIWSQTVPAAVLIIPDRVLQPGDYVVVLKGINANGEVVDAGEFYFKVVQR